MPLFEYACKKCGNEFEALVRGAERPTCPACRSASLERRLSTFNAGASKTLPRACAGATPFCQPGQCDPALCAHAH
jgi:putative FmdB family regulatory protein